MPIKHVFERDLPLEPDGEIVEVDDAGQALIAEFSADTLDQGVFVRLQSWDPHPNIKHQAFRELLGKRVRITVEVIDL